MPPAPPKPRPRPAAPSTSGRRAAAVVAAGVLAIYLTVWSHEFGHALAAFLLGCREGWRPRAVTLWLAGSRPGGIDAACLAARGRGAVAAVALAGIAVNLLLAAISAAVLAAGAAAPRDAARPWRCGLLLVALANAAEAISYLVPNAVVPRSDMATAIAAAGAGRIPWLAAGLALGGLLALALRRPVREAARALAAPTLPAAAWRWGFLLYAVVVGAAAVVSRQLLG